MNRRSITVALGCAAAALTTLGQATIAHAQDCQWNQVLTAPIPQFPHANSAPSSFVWFDVDGSGTPKLIAGTRNQGVYQLDPSGWTHVGTNSPATNALAIYDDGGGPTLYAGGAGGLFKLSAGVWQHIPGAYSYDEVLALQTHDDGSGPALFIGLFIAGGSGRPVFKYNGGIPQPVGAVGELNGWIQSFAEFDEDGNGPNPPQLFATGYVSTVAGTSAVVARWDGAHWTPVGGLPGGWCKALAVFDDGQGARLYATGHSLSPTYPNGMLSTVLRWDGSAWTYPLNSSGHLDASFLEQPFMGFAGVQDGTGHQSLFMHSANIVGPGPGLLRYDGLTVSTVPGVEGTEFLEWNYPYTPAVIPAHDGIPATLIGADSTGGLFRISLCSQHRADINADGVVDIHDLLDFITGWFAQDPGADFNGTNGITVMDIFDFLSAWFAS